MEVFLILFIFSMQAVLLYPMANKIEKIPMKTYGDTVIPDGEFLHYIVYFGGEKDSDYYYVTRKETDENGALYYRIYYIAIPVTEGKKPPENYSNWPSTFMIDPARGSLIESEVRINPNDSVVG